MKKIIGALLSATLVSVSTFAVNCKRTVSVISSKEMRVEITVNKQQVSGIARLAEFIPEGAVIKYAKSEGGSFNVSNNKIKFIWMTLPSTDNITVAYTLNTEKLHQGDYSITGKFSFLEGNETREFSIDTSTFYVSATNEVKLANTSPSVTAVLPPVVNETPVSNKVNVNDSPVPSAVKINETPASSTVKVNETPVPVAETKANKIKVVYGIQVASTQKQLPGNYFSANYNIKDNVKVENSDGQFKYILGEFNDIKTASNFREAIVKKGLKDSFLVAFTDNHRISITEAKKLEAAGDK